MPTPPSAAPSVRRPRRSPAAAAPRRRRRPTAAAPRPRCRTAAAAAPPRRRRVSPASSTRHRASPTRLQPGSFFPDTPPGLPCSLPCLPDAPPGLPRPDPAHGASSSSCRRRLSSPVPAPEQYRAEQLKPLQSQLARVRDLPAPEFGSLQSWERANIGAFANGDSGAADSSRNSQGQYNGTPMPFLGETKVEVALSGAGVKEEGAESGTAGTALKVLPPWMIKEGMNLTKEQRGETSSTSKLDEKSEGKDDKKQDSKEDKSIQDEYIKAYYEALRKRQEEEDAKRRMQQEGQTFASESNSKRQVGMKSKREDGDDEDEGVEWEEDQPAGNTDETYKLADLNAEAQESGDEEDDIDWEEG